MLWLVQGVISINYAQVNAVDKHDNYSCIVYLKIETTISSQDSIMPVHLKCTQVKKSKVITNAI